MPEFFTLFVPDFPKAKSRVDTGRRKHDLNTLDWERPHTGLHRFLTLGNAWYVVRTLLDDSGESLSAVIRRSLGHSLPQDLLDRWRAVNGIRNKGSHVSPLNQSDYHEVLDNVIRSRMLEALVRIKQALRG